MVETMRICAMNKCVEGDERSFGTVSFDKKKLNGDHYKCCDHCVDNYKRKDGRRNDIERRKFNTPYDNIVYGFKEGKDFVYIGSSSDGPLRMYEHMYKKSGKSVFHAKGINRLMRELRFQPVVLWNGDSDEDRLHQEKALIQIHQPKFNKIIYKNYDA